MTNWDSGGVVDVSESEPTAELVGARPEVGAAVSPGSQSTNSGLSQRVRKGAVWSAGTVVLMRFGNIAIMAIVARLVAPEQFGVFALAITAHGMVICLSELGVASAVARADVDLAKVAPTVVSIAIVTSLVLGGALAAAAEPLSNLLGSADAAGPLRVLAIGVAVAGPFSVPAAQLQREFRQRRIFVANSIAFGAGSAVLLALSSAGDGAMAFAWSTVARQLVSGVILITGVSRVYRPGFRRAELPPLLRFGVPLALANLLSQVLLNVDYVFIGRAMSTEDVGLYMLAFNIAGWPIAVLGSTLNGVVIPAFSRVEHELRARSDALRRASATVALVACPIGAMTLALADPLILTVYGEKWAAASSVLSVLAVYGVLTVFGLLFANVAIAVGRTGILLGVQIAALVLLVPTMAIGIGRHGLVGVGLAHLSIVTLVTIPAYMFAMRRSIGTRPSVVIRAMVPAISAATAAGAVAWAVSELFRSATVQLLLGGTVGVAIYGVLMARRLVELFPAALSAPRRMRTIISRARRATNWSATRLGQRTVVFDDPLRAECVRDS